MSDASVRGTYIRRVFRALLGLAGAGLAVAIGAAILTLPDRPAALAAEVMATLDRSGVASPVTAVLLNFRAYDTLLEVAVVLAAVVAVWALDRGAPPMPSPAAAVDPVPGALARLVVPLAVLAGVYLTWAGTYRAGGAFQAGSLVGGALVLLLAAGIVRPRVRAVGWLRAAVVAALAVFTTAAVAGLLSTGRLLEYPPGTASRWIVVMESTLAVSIAAILADLFVDVPALAGPAAGPEDPR